MAHTLTIEHVGGGYRVHRDGVDLVPNRIKDEDFARDEARRLRLPGERVYLHHTDGYREEITRDFPSPSPRRPERAQRREVRRARHSR